MKYKLKSNTNINKANDILELICLNRGIEYRNLEEFLNPREDSIQNPLTYKNLELAAVRILENVKNNKKIAFVVDSDVDGYCSSAILINYLVEVLHYNNVYWILHEEKDHGLTDKILSSLSSIDYDVVILPDSSSSDFEQHKKLCEIGKEVIVIDHHETEKYSEHAIVVNNQLSPNGNKTLCGAGMVMKLLEYIDILTSNKAAHNYMDLCAIALVGDCMDMTQAETRYYVETGLRNIKNPLLFELYNALKEKSFEMISFDIAPTINAFIRVGDMEQKSDLFCSMIGFNYTREIKIKGKGTFILELPQYIAALSNRIKSRQSSAIKKAIEEQSITLSDDSLPFSVLLLDNEVNRSLTGLIGNNLVGKHKKPYIILKRYENEFKGSGRTIDTFPDFKSYLNDLGYFEYCEGHQGAFGVKIVEEKLDKLLKEMKDKKLGEGCDVEVVDKAYYNRVSAFEIMTIGELSNKWSKGFDKPLFYIKIDDVEKIKAQIIGQKRDTIKITYDNIDYIKFKCSEEEINTLKETIISSIELIGSFNINEWNDNIRPQVVIEKLEIIGKKIETNETFYVFQNIKW